MSEISLSPVITEKAHGIYKEHKDTVEYLSQHGFGFEKLAATIIQKICKNE